MDWITWVVLAVAVLGFLLFRRSQLVREPQAREYLAQGAMVIDVRTEEEFRQGHVPGAVNIPLDVLSDRIGKQAPKKDQALLLHCAGGVRSAAGCRTLRQLGYTKAYNLGSYGRAASIAGKGRGKQ